MSAALVVLRSWLVRLGFALGARRPLRAEVVLATGRGRRITGNLKAVEEAIHRQQPGARVRTLAYGPTRRIADKLRAGLYAILAGYHLATARLFVVDDYFFPIYVIKPRAGTTIVQAWHASGAFKKFGYSLAGKTFGASPALLRRVRIHANYDLCLVSSKSVAHHYAEAFRLPMDRFVAHIGIPRTDLFFDAERRRATVEAVRRLYRLPDGKKVILYAPTFRGARVDEAHHHEELDLAHLRDVIGDDHVLLLRAHPFVRSWTVADPSMQEFAIDVSDHKDIQELMLVADLLITDYSSVIFEYSLLRRPIVFYAPDHQAYQRERGFYLDFPRDLPGPVFDTTDALAAHLRAEQFDLEAIDRFSRSSFDVADGHASQRFVDEVVVPALGDRR